MASFEAKRAFSTLVLQCQIYRFTAIPGEKKSVWGVPERDTRDYERGGDTPVTIEFSLVTFWQLTETFHDQSIARQE